MKLITSVHIDTSTDLEGLPSYSRLDLFDFETIELTSSIQDVRDPASIFTDFTQEFTIPASQVNNKLLSHFYNSSITNGYDARVKRKGTISLNGIKFRDGYIRLSEANLKNGKPYSYSITFFGSMVSLKDVLGDDELKDLILLGNYNHPYNISTVYSGFSVGLALDTSNDVVESNVADVIYPSISSENRWFYDTAGTPGSDVAYNQGRSKNIWVDTHADISTGIDYTELKPALRVRRILDAIEDKYTSVNFSNDFFSDIDFNNLYMLLHNVKGGITNSTTGLSQEMVFSLSTGIQGDFNETGVTGLLPIETWTKSGSFGVGNIKRTASVSVDITALTGIGDKVYEIEVLEGNNTLVSGSFSDLNLHTLGFTLETANTKFWDIRVKITSPKSELQTFDLAVRLAVYEESVGEGSYGDAYIYSTTYNATYTSKVNTMLSTIDINSQMPKMKVVDFLKGLFMMFNLTAYVEDGVIIVKTLNQYYYEGVDIDLSNEIDMGNTTIKRAKLYSNIDFRFSEPKTYGLVKQNEINQDEYGDLQFQATPDGKNGNLVFDGGKYEIKLPFEKLFFDRLSDEADVTSLQPWSNGWLVDKDQSSTLTNPVLFFNRQTNATGANIGFKNVGKISYYNRPSNTTISLSKSLHFNQENDEYTGLAATNSLFSLFYKDYISNLFRITSRMVKYSAILKLKTLLSYKMNDRIIVNGNAYRINTINTNLTSGKSDIELLSDFPITSAILSSDVTIPTVPTSLAVASSQVNSLNITWVASTDNVAVAGYEIYVDSVLNATVGNITSYEITGLVGGTAYSIDMLAFDASNNKSAKTSAVTGTTAVGADVTPPSPVTDLSSTTVTGTTITIVWSTPSDNVGVTGYDIDLNQSFHATIGAVNTYEFTGLTSQTTYRIAMEAKDLAGNISTISNIIDVTTT